MSVELHAVVQNKAKLSQVSCSQFPPMVIPCKIVAHHHKGPSCGPSTAILTSYPLPPPDAPVTTNLISFSNILPLKKCFINVIMQYVIF